MFASSEQHDVHSIVSFIFVSGIVDVSDESKDSAKHNNKLQTVSDFPGITELDR